MGILYIVATPIGNMQDITIRAIQTLQNVDVIACEDTRRTGILLANYPINIEKKPRLISYYEQNEALRIPEVISLLKSGLNVALISDAGTPAISDPGFKLVRECIKENIKVESIPGPSSVISSLIISGLPTDKFLFLGYLPKKPGHRKDALSKILELKNIIKATIIIFEAPHKTIRTLEEMKDIFGNIDVVVARELTKIHEEVVKDSLGSLILKFKKSPPKGEIVVLFNFHSN